MFLVLCSTLILVVLSVFVHYEALSRMNRFLHEIKLSGRSTVVLGVLASILAHVIEVWLFGLGYYLVLQFDPAQSIVMLNGETATSFFDCVYFSFVNYTSLGYGDLMPSGHIRFMAGTEALVGLVFIAWTASFLYMELQRQWSLVPRKQGNN